MSTSDRIDLKPWIGSLLFLPACVYFVATRGQYTFMDHADLIIHEAGHLFFSPFGYYLRVGGGTLMQLLLPALLSYSFFRNDYLIGTQVSLFWLGHNLLNVSVYAGDARARQLNLITGDPDSHDWWNLLGRLGILPYDWIIAAGFVALALGVFAILLYLPRRMWA